MSPKHVCRFTGSLIEDQDTARNLLIQNELLRSTVRSIGGGSKTVQEIRKYGKETDL